jgi:hypothetical protein
MNIALRVVGGTDFSDFTLSPNSDSVRREAMRRISALDHMRHAARYLALGTPIPQHIRHLVLQINFVADTLSALDEIPHDFRSDAYWPSGDAQA